MARGSLCSLVCISHIPLACSSHRYVVQVWRPDAVIEIKADVESPPLQLTPPATRYFRGRWVRRGMDK